MINKQINKVTISLIKYWAPNVNMTILRFFKIVLGIRERKSTGILDPEFSIYMVMITELKKRGPHKQ